jgi:hypothetical protein
MAKLRRGSIAGAFAWRLTEMLESPAHRTLSLSARKILDRLEIEFYRHGGKPEENGRLPCTFDHFVEFGIHRHAIGPAIREVVALGFVEITRKGSAGNAGYRQPTLYRLTYRHSGSNKRVTDDWRRIGTIEEAEAIAERARKVCEPERRAHVRQKNKSPVSETITGFSVGNRTNRGHSPVSETITTAPVPETVITSISRVGTPHLIDGYSTPADSTAQGSPKRPADTAVAAPVFDLIEGSFRIGDRRIALRRPVAPLLNLTAGQLAQHLAASHPSKADKPVRPRLAAIAGTPTPAIAAE